MAYRLLGSATTDNDGKATHTYTGVGAGEIDVVSSLDNPLDESSLVSEIYETLDCIYIDKCTQSDHANWNSTDGFTWNDGKCTVTKSSSWFGRIVTSISGDFKATFKLSSTNGGRLAMYNASNVNQSRQWNFTNTNEQYFQIYRINGVWTAQTSTDGENWTNLQERSDDTDLTTEDVYFGFIMATSSSRSITFHDLKAYPI